MDQYIGAIDQGTSSTRFIIFDRRGLVVAQDQLEHRQIYPEPGMVEHNPLEIWENTQKVMVGAFSKAGIKARQVVSIGITNQRETMVLWDRLSGKPVYNALVWQDTRTAELCEDIDRRHGAFIRQKTGLPVNTYFSASKLMYLLDTVPGARLRAERGELLAGTMDTWLLWNLSGGSRHGLHLTDVSNASRTQLMDLCTLSWCPELLNIFNIPRSILPEIRPSSSFMATARVLGHSFPIGAMIGDQQGALFGHGCFNPGEAKNTYGTGCFLLLNTGTMPQFSTNGLLSSVAYQLEGQAPVFCLEGSVAVAGALVQWLRDNIGLIASSSEIEALAAKVPNNAGVYLVPAFSGLFAPWWRPDARGTLLGLSSCTNRSHIARAALEASAYQSQDVLTAMAKDSGMPLQSLRVDGGMTVNRLLMQFQADISGIPVSRAAITETTALGAAFAAGLSAGFWADCDEIKSLGHVGETWNPQMDEQSRRAHIHDWHRAVERSFAWVEHQS